ncbi:MAG TPA: hypothetical protein VED46_14270 [Alphaproteobacteria bacterium]|nr:hypothetical protein [Alphaproteobacteria bacterium]
MHAQAIVASVYAYEELLKWREATFSAAPRPAIVSGRRDSHLKRAEVLGSEILAVQFASAAAAESLSRGYELMELSQAPDLIQRKLERVEFNLSKLSETVATPIRAEAESRGKDFAVLLGKLRNAAAYANENDPSAIEKIRPEDSEMILDVIERAFRVYDLEPGAPGTP